MKKLLILLTLFILVGFGCTKSTPKTQENQQDDMTQSIQSISINENGETKVIQNGEEVKNIEKDNEGVPIIDIALNSSNSVRTIDLKIGNFFFEPKTITAKPGEKLRIDFRGVIGNHTLLIDAANVKQTIKDGSGFEFTVPTESGSYPIYCDIDGHRTNGMEGTLIVK